MIRKSCYLVLAILLLAGSAYAGAIRVNQGANPASNYVVTWETLSTARTVNMLSSAANNGVVNYVTGANVNSSDLLRVVLTGAVFTATPIYVCLSGNLTNYWGTKTPTSGDTETYIPFDRDTLSGYTLWLTTNVGTGSNCAAPAVGNFTTNISATTGTTTPTIAGSLVRGGVTYDSAAAAQMMSIQRQFISGQYSTSHTIDYLGTPGNGTRILNTAGGTPTTIADARAATATQNTISINVVGTNNYTAHNAGVTASAVLSLTDTAAWAGISNLYLMTAGTACANATSLVNQASPTGTVSLTIPQGSFNATSVTSGYNLCVEVNGTTALAPRTIATNVTLNMTNGQSAGASGDANAMLWDLNAYQAFVPWVVNNASYKTYCLISNNSPSLSSNAILEVMSSEDTVVVASTTIGSVAAKTSKLLSFDVDSLSLTGGTAMSTSTVGTDKRYSAKLTVTSNPQNITVACVQMDPGGAKRNVPVLTNSGAANPYRQ